jgi:hypothetical protein
MGMVFSTRFELSRDSLARGPYRRWRGPYRRWESACRSDRKAAELKHAGRTLCTGTP